MCFFLLLSISLIPARKTKWFLLVFSTLFILMAIEFVFYWQEVGSFAEMFRFNYNSPFIYNRSNIYNTWPPNSTHKLAKHEFDYDRTTNSLGFSDKEWGNKDTGTYRLFTLGDSFTEGDGAHRDSSYPSLLQNLVSSDGNLRHLEVCNAGTCGSDPVYNLKNLTEKLMAFNPDMVVQVINTHDLYSDYYYKGGFDRYDTDSTQLWRKAPNWEILSAISEISKLVMEDFGYNLSYPNQSTISKNQIAHINDYLSQILSKYANISSEKSIAVVLVLLPMSSELESGIYDFDLSYFKSEVTKHKDIQLLDLMPCYTEALQASNSSVYDYYWKLDKHHNAEGYALKAKCIYNYIASQIRNEKNQR